MLVVAHCFYCEKAKGPQELNPLTRSPAEREKLVEGMRVLDMNPCDECRDWMKRGVMLIEIHDNLPTEMPTRTGRMAVMANRWIEDVFNATARDMALKDRWSYVPARIWEQLGLDQGEGERVDRY